jgi:NitT/TauT family transport system substrate-binding protein
MNHFCRLSGLIAAAIVTAAIPSANAAETIRFLNDWLPSGDKAAIYLGVQKGVFAAEGLDVTIQNARGSSDVVTKLATGVADVGTGGLSALLQAKAENAVGVTAVLSIYTQPPHAIFTAGGSGIASLKDVAGKKIATATFSSSNVVWPPILQANGVDPAKIELLKVDPAALAPLLASGQVAGTINWITVAPGFEGPLAETKKTLKVIRWSDYGYDSYGLSLFVSDKMIKEKPETVKKFVRAFAKAHEMAIASPKDAALALKAIVPEIDAVVAEKQFAASIPLMTNEIARAAKGGFDKALLAKTWDWTAKAQNIPLSKIDPEGAVNRSFVP